ncbi:hypothetical protein P4544_06655 [Halomonas sp. LY9]
MTNSLKGRPRRISAKAGDIFVTKANSCSSRLIRAATVSKWSHVGIAINDEFILEAIKAHNGLGDYPTQVRVIPIADFADHATTIRRYIRPGGLSSSQQDKLISFSESEQNKGYTALHAALTALIPITRIFFIVIAIFSMIYIWPEAAFIEAKKTSFFFAALSILGVIFFIHLTLVWSFRVRWGMEAIEAVFRKCRLGNWLVEIKHEMFCSRLILLADKEIHGPLAALLPNEYEIQPKHVAKACEKLDWEPINF